MDPLSVTASAIAVGGFVASIGKGINTLRSLRDAPDEFMELLNELAMLQIVMSKFEDLFVRFPAADLGIFGDNLSQTIRKLDELAARFEKGSKGIDQNGRHRIPPIQWRRERANIQRMRDQARQTRDYLAMYLTTLNTSQSLVQSSLSLDIMAISRFSSNNLACQQQSTSSIESQLDRIQDQLRDIAGSQASIAGNHVIHHAIHEQKIQRAIEHASSPGVAESECSSYVPGSAHLPSTDLSSIPTQREQEQVDPYPQSRGTDPILRLKRVSRCPLACRCRCHTATAFQAPAYAHKVIGAFFLSYNAMTRFGDQPCNYVGCSGPPSSRIQFDYHLPSWIASCAVQFSISWDPLYGRGATLSLKAPRVLRSPESRDDIWTVVARGRLDYLRKRLSAREIFPTDISTRGETLLLYALLFHQWEIARELLQAGSDVSARSACGLSAALLAKQHLLLGTVYCDEGLRLCQQVVELAEPEHNSTIIHDSVLGLNGVTVEQAIALDPGCLNSPDSFGNTPLHLAVALKQHEALEALLRANVSADVRDIQSQTPLHVACQSGDIFALERLLTIGVDIDARDVNNFTPLHIAINVCLPTEEQPGALKVLNILLKSGCDVEAGDGNGRSPLNWFVVRSYTLTNVGRATIDALLDAGADINRPDHWGESPLFNSIKYYKPGEIFGFLHSRGADLEVLSERGDSILHFVAWWGDLTLINYLKRLPALNIDPDLKNDQGDTPMSYLVWRRDASSKELLDQWQGYVRKPTADEFLAFESLVEGLRESRERDSILVESLPLRDYDTVLEFGNWGYASD